MAVRARLVSEELSGPASFMLVEMKGADAVPIYDGDGQLLKFMTGEEAGRVAAGLTDRMGVKVQPRRINDKNWKERETHRMKDGTYVPLPWADQKWWGELLNIHEHHFPHVSLQKTALVAYTEDDAKGSADVQTPMKVGRYLERYFSAQLNQFVIRDLAAIFASKYEDNKLQYASEQEDLEEIFTEGPTSCMSKPASEYKTGGVHPVRMYAAGDLQLAYLRRQGRVVARAIVWPERKLYNTPYGDSARLKDLLHKEGFKPGAPIGARLLRQKFLQGKGPQYTFISPHVDNSSLVIDNGEFLIVGDPNARKDADRGLATPGGTGHSEVCGFVCVHCKKDSFSQRQIVTVIDNTGNGHDALCKECSKTEAVECGHTGSLIYKGNAVKVGTVWIWSREVHKATFRCAGSGELALLRDMVRMPDGQMWSKQYAKTNSRVCKCGAAVAKSDACDGGECHFKQPKFGLSVTFVEALREERRR